MIKSSFNGTATQKERAVLVGVEWYERDAKGPVWPVEDSLEELSQLALTAGMEVVGQTFQRIAKPNPATLIGKGKMEEVRWLVEEHQADTVIFDAELSPRQQREIERELREEVKVLDRTVLILDIFAQHARTREGALQVELAQYEYRLPRLTRAWTHLARQTGGAAGRSGIGGVGLRGPGEAQLEVDRREIRRHIAHLKRQLQEVQSHRRLYRTRRQQMGIPVVSIVGYTNAGKSSLLNALSGADILVANQLFATLDPTTRRVRLPNGREVLFTDTVGFIQKLPTTLVAAFRATLEEVLDADILLHVIDVTHPHAGQQVVTVGQVLAELGATDKPIISALNKIDLLPDGGASLHETPALTADSRLLRNAIPISAKRGIGLDILLQRIGEVLAETMVPISLLFPYCRSDLVATFHRQGIVEAESHDQAGTHITGRIPPSLLSLFQPYYEEAPAV